MNRTSNKTRHSNWGRLLAQKNQERDGGKHCMLLCTIQVLGRRGRECFCAEVMCVMIWSKREGAVAVWGQGGRCCFLTATRPTGCSLAAEALHCCRRFACLLPKAAQLLVAFVSKFRNISPQLTHGSVCFEAARAGVDIARFSRLLASVSRALACAEFTLCCWSQGRRRLHMFGGRPPRRPWLAVHVPHIRGANLAAGPAQTAP